MEDYQPTATGPSAPAPHSWDASNYSGSNRPWNAADDNNSTMWSEGSGTFPQWWEYTPDASVCFAKASIRSQIGGGNRAPKDFTIEGYDGEWHVLKTVVESSGWGSGEIRYFEWTNTNSYSKYRIHITANDGHANYVSMAEVEWSETGATGRSSMVIMT